MHITRELRLITKFSLFFLSRSVTHSLSRTHKHIVCASMIRYNCHDFAKTHTSIINTRTNPNRSMAEAVCSIHLPSPLITSFFTKSHSTLLLTRVLNPERSMQRPWVQFFIYTTDNIFYFFINFSCYLLSCFLNDCMQSQSASLLKLKAEKILNTCNDSDNYVSG